MKTKLFALLGLFLVLGMFGAAYAENFAITDVDFRDPYTPGATIPVKITLANTDASQDLIDINIKAWLEDRQGDKVTDKASIDVAHLSQDSEKEDLVISIPTKASLEEDIYTLQIVADGEWEDSGVKASAEWSGSLEIEQKDNSLLVSNVQIEEQTMLAGDSVDIAITILNNGVNDQSDIKIKVSIPELNVAKTISVLDTLMQNGEYTAYMTFDIPKNADTGIYTLNVNVYNSKAGDINSQNIVIQGVEQAPANVVTTTVSQTQEIPFGKGSVFSIEVKNNANTQKTFEFSLAGTQDWTSSARVDPQTLSLGAGGAQTIYVYVIPSASGSNSFTLYTKENGNIVGATQMNVQVTGGQTAGITLPSDSQTSLKYIFAALIIILIAVIFYRVWTSGDKGEKEEQVYY